MNAATTASASQERSLRRWAGWICLAAFLTLLLFVTASRLHLAAHADANTPGHHCVITLLAQGQLNAPDLAPALVTLVAALFFLPPLIAAAVLPSFDYRLSPSRAPPRS